MAVPNNGDSSEPSSRAPVAFPDFRLFDSAQDILDHNKRIVKELRVNHEAQTPEALARNCLLIRELNTNIEAVMRAYKSISDSFGAYMETQQMLQQQRAQQLQQQQQQQQQAQEQGQAAGAAAAQQVAEGAQASGAGDMGGEDAAVPQAPPA